MWQIKYSQITVTLSAAICEKLADPFSGYSRLADSAVERLRIAILDIFPHRTPEERRDKSQYHGAWRYPLLIWYDLVCSVFRRLIGQEPYWGKPDNIEEPQKIVLNIPIGLMKWVEQIAHDRKMSISEAMVYAIEHGIKVLDSQRNPEKQEEFKQMWRDVWRSIWSRS